MSVLSDVFARQLIRRKARQLLERLSDPAIGVEDLESRLQWALYRRSRHFDASKAAWTTFVVLVLEHEVADILQQRRPPTQSAVASGAQSFDPPDPETVHCRSQSRADLRTDLQSILTRLSPVDRDFCHDVMNADSVSDQSRRTGRSRQSIYRMLARLREMPHFQKLRENL